MPRSGSLWEELPLPDLSPQLSPVYNERLFAISTAGNHACVKSACVTFA